MGICTHIHYTHANTQLLLVAIYFLSAIHNTSHIRFPSLSLQCQQRVYALHTPYVIYKSVSFDIPHISSHSQYTSVRRNKIYQICIDQMYQDKHLAAAHHQMSFDHIDPYTSCISIYIYNAQSNLVIKRSFLF